MRTTSLAALMLMLGLTACIGADSMAPSAVMSVPTDVRAEPGDGIISLSWSPVPGATSYNIYWSSHPGVSPRTGTRIAGLGSAYVQSGLINGRTYYYVVTAANSQQESKASSEIDAMPVVIPIVLSANAPPAGTVGRAYYWISGIGHDLCTYAHGCVPCSATVSCAGVPPCGRPACVETVLKHSGGWMIAAQGGRAPYTWRVSGLPPGLSSSIVPGGMMIVGVPTAAGSYVVTVTLDDSHTPPQTASVTETIVINP
jgi:hypothetical protein